MMNVREGVAAMTTLTVDTVSITGTGLVYKELVLDKNRDALVEWLVSHHQYPRPRAEAMIDQWWGRLVKRLVADYPHKGVDQPLAERIMNEAFGFMYLCSNSGGYGPSPTVDLGWHTAILYTVEYAALSDVLCGRFLHHLPTDVVGFTARDHQAEKCGSHCDSTHCGNGSHCVHCDGDFSSQLATGRPIAAVRVDSGLCYNAHCNGGHHCMPSEAFDSGDSTLVYPDGNCVTASDLQALLEGSDCGSGCNIQCNGTCGPQSKEHATGGESPHRPRTIADTVAALRLLGPVDEALWVTANATAKCGDGNDDDPNTAAGGCDFSDPWTLNQVLDHTTAASSVELPGCDDDDGPVTKCSVPPCGPGRQSRASVMIAATQSSCNPCHQPCSTDPLQVVGATPVASSA